MLPPPSVSAADRQQSRSRPDRRRLQAELRQTLLAQGSANTGWGYYPGKASRLEPTCWALLALARDAGAPVDLDVLRRWPRQEGWLVDVKGAPVNYAFNALAALTLLQHPDGSALAEPVVTRLVAAKGVKLEQGDAIRQDNSLQAWPWIDQTFSWVEPTAWCLLVLKKVLASAGPNRLHQGYGGPPKLHAKAEGPASIGRASAAAKEPASKGLTARPEIEERIRIGERMLLDRACRTGGWNYGSSNVYGQELWAYVPTTALALMAMQDRRDDPVVVKSLQFLQKDADTERSAGALALAAISLRVFNVPAAPIEQELVQRIELSRSLGNTVALATSLYALAETRHGMAAFTI